MKKNTPLVSIDCITYNHAPYIRECLEGFLMQKVDFNYEILIHDDASTDGTADIIREYEAKYPDIIKPIYQKENQYSKGIPISITYQFPRAKGKYVALCEGDDYWTDPYKLQKQVGFLEKNSNYGIVYTDINIYHEASESYQYSVFKNKIRNRTQDFEEHLVSRGFLAPLTWVFRKKLLKEIDVFPSLDGSFVLMLEFFQHTQVHYLSDVTAVYRKREGSASNQTDPLKSYNYHKGVFEIQKVFIMKYNLNEAIADWIKSDAYFLLIKNAILLKDNDFVSEMKTFFIKKNINIQRIIDTISLELNEERKTKNQSHFLYKYMSKIYKFIRNE